MWISGAYLHDAFAIIGINKMTITENTYQQIKINLSQTFNF